MAIKFEGEKRTAKQLAEELLADGISKTRGYWYENSSVDADDMTEKEKERVREQLQKIGDRLARRLGFEESWSS